MLSYSLIKYSLNPHLLCEKHLFIIDYDKEIYVAPSTKNADCLPGEDDMFDDSISIPEYKLRKVQSEAVWGTLPKVHTTMRWAA